jgi:hypothetical protein
MISEQQTGKEAVTAKLKVQSQKLPKGAVENHRKPQTISQQTFKLNSLNLQVRNLSA